MITRSLSQDLARLAVVVLRTAVLIEPSRATLPAASDRNRAHIATGFQPRKGLKDSERLTNRRQVLQEPPSLAQRAAVHSRSSMPPRGKVSSVGSRALNELEAPVRLKLYSHEQRAGAAVVSDRIPAVLRPCRVDVGPPVKRWQLLYVASPGGCSS